MSMRKKKKKKNCFLFKVFAFAVIALLDYLLFPLVFACTLQRYCLIEQEQDSSLLFSTTKQS
jgi:hypothetical protein